MGTKERIFDCALSLFSENGFDGVSIRDIARAVGINESSIYNHYDGKKAIIDDVCKRFAATLAVSRPPLSEIEKWLEYMQPREIFKTLISAYGRQINPQIGQMAKTIFSEQFHNELAKEIFMNELIKNSNYYYAEVLDLLEKRDKIKKCKRQVVASLFNNAQVTFSMQFAHCKLEEEFKQVAQMMMDSADFLIGSLEKEK